MLNYTLLYYVYATINVASMAGAVAMDELAVVEIEKYGKHSHICS